MRKVLHLGAFTKESRDIVNTNFLLSAFGTVGSVAYLAPAVGNDTTGVLNDPDLPYDTLTGAYGALTTGKNDICLLVGDGGTTGTARQDLAFTWAKNATHLFGLASPSLFSSRARIAPTSTTVGAAGNINYMTVSGSGNYFANLQIWAGFATGLANTIALTVSGSRNVFENCHIVGLADAVSAADAGSRCLKITGHENLFRHCVIGIDTVSRGAANASVELASMAARNVFEDCTFVSLASAATPIYLKVAAVQGIDRLTSFLRCRFQNFVAGPTGTTLTGVATMAVNAGGLFYMEDCVRIGVTDWGTDAASLAQIYLSGLPAGAQAAAGTVLGDDIGRVTVAVSS